MKECQACKHCFPDQFNNCPTDGGELTSSIAGDTILDGRYQLERRLGQGGMGIVYKARHIFLKTTFAIKVILPDLVGNDPMLATRFRQEAMLAARIGHRNIVNVTDFGVVGKMPYLVMDFIQGQSLHELLSTERRLSAQPAFEIMSAICAGVGAAHRQGIVHRDLKPLNVMMKDGLPYSEAVKVLDFGLAKIKSGELLGSFVAAQTTGLMGSPSYMAPELWSEDEPDARADIYSLGVILFQMFTGEVPFKGPSLPAIMKKHLSDRPPRFLEVGVNVPNSIEMVVHHSLAKRREDRMSSVEEFIAELRAAVQSADASSARISMEETREFAAETIQYSSSMDSLTVTGSDQGGWDSQTRTDSQQRIEDEADRLNREFEEAQRRADEARSRAEEAARKRAEEEAARRRAEEEAERKLAEEEAARRHAEELARKREQEALERRRAEEEAARKLAEEEARQRAEEEAARQRAAEEAARLAREIVEAKKRAEEARLIAQSESRKRSEEEVARRRAEEEAQRLAQEVAEAQRRAEEARARAEEEARKRAEEEEARRAAEEEEERLRQEESIRIQAEGEAARQRIAEDAERIAREIAEAQQRAEMAGSRAEEEARKRAEAEGARARAEEEARKLGQQMAELQRRAEESRRRSEEEAAQREKLEKQRRRDEEIQRQREAQLAREAKAKQAALEAQLAREAKEKQAALDQAAALHASVAPREPSRAGGSMSNADLSEVTVLGAARQAEASMGTSRPFETSIPAAPSKRSYAIPIVIVVALVLIGGLIAGGALLYTRKLSPETPPQGSPTPSGSQTPAPPAKFKPEMARIEGGSFQMGLNDAASESLFDLSQYPARTVTVGSFSIDKTEITNSEYADFIAATKYAAPSYWANSKPPAGQERFPVTYVSVADAKAFADWRSKRDNKKYRLPTEEEWEYVARNGKEGTLYPWGNEWVDGSANVGAVSLEAVGSRQAGASRQGVMDLIGNAWEWTSTRAAPYPGNTRFEVAPGQVIIRGGAYPDKARGADAITATRRSWLSPTDKQAMIGFRLVHE